MNFAKFLLETENEYNSHKQTEVKGLPIEEGMKLCKELEELEPFYSFVVELWSDGNYTIYQKNFFDVGNPTGRDRMILGVEN